MARRHEHRFTPLSQRMGPHGDQAVHYHPCIADANCAYVLTAKGHSCDGKASSHQLGRLGSVFEGSRS